MFEITPQFTDCDPLEDVMNYDSRLTIEKSQGTEEESMFIIAQALVDDGVPYQLAVFCLSQAETRKEIRELMSRWKKNRSDQALLDLRKVILMSPFTPGVGIGF